MSFVSRLLMIVAVASISACGGASDRNKKKGAIRSGAGKPGYEMKETIAKGSETAMIEMAAQGGRMPVTEVICQKWKIATTEDEDSWKLLEDKNNLRNYNDLVLFSDQSVVQSSRNRVSIGKWAVQRGSNNRIMLFFYFPDGQVEYLIRSANKQTLWLEEKGNGKKTFDIQLTGDGLRHENILNDPFHPSNLTWRLKPAKKESDSLIYDRVKNCLKFFALYYRDNIKRDKSTISFLELPVIFKWYSGGIGLPDRNELSDSWINSFYNEAQAQQGYSVLRDLIVDYEFNWDKAAPNWVYQTHSVLEQMYNKMEHERGKLRIGHLK
jgi:hypothetical protein